MRNISLDILKLILAILVVILHMRFLVTVSPVLGHLIVNGICRIAVPVFLIISGYFFLSVDTKVKLLHWCKWVIILYLIWTVLYSFMWVGDSRWQNKMMNLLFGYFHLWYLVGLLLGALVLFLFRCWKYLIHFIITSFIVGYIVQFAVVMEKIDYGAYNIYLYRNFLFFCFPFLSVGYLLAKRDFAKKLKPPFWSVCLALMLLLIESFGYFMLKGEVTDLDLLLSNMLVCPLVFLFILNKTISGSSKYIAIVSSSIYLVHPFVLKNLSFFHIDELGFIFQKLIVFLLIFSVSSLIVMLNSKLKYLL